MNKKLIAGFCLMAALWSGVVSAAPRWQTWKEDDKGAFYYDLASLKRTGDLITVTEKTEPREGVGVSCIVYYREYLPKKLQWRTLGRKVYSSKGKFLSGNKKLEKWQKVKAKSEMAGQMEYLLAASRLQGPWVSVKRIGDLAVKYYNPDTLTSPKKGVLEVWERLEMLDKKQKIRNVVTFVRYDLDKAAATTMYTCDYDAWGHLLEANGEVDHWNADGDTYGEYIGNELALSYNSQKTHK